MAQLQLLLVEFGSFSLGLVQLTSQRSRLGVQRELRLRALRGVRLQLGLRKAWRWMTSQGSDMFPASGWGITLWNSRGGDPPLNGTVSP